MKQINFVKHILPHLVAVIVFLVVTLLFFSPFFFENKSLDQSDINQWKAGAQSLIDYREATGKEGLWSNSMFSGMPGYLINVKWNDGIITGIKQVLALGIAHPVRNIFISFISFYILLLAFRVRPYLAIAGALSFGLCSYLIIGLGAGHNSRIGAIAFMPLVLAGIHTTFFRNKILGIGLTAAALALELRENHLQITYYLMIMIVIYGIIILIEAIRNNRVKDFIIKTAWLIAVAILALGTFFGKFWATYEYSQYSIRGKSELTADVSPNETGSGLKKSYAFEYSNDALGPFTLLIPNFLGGDYSNFLIQDEDSEVLKTLQRSNNQQAANQLAQYSSAYWGDKPPAPYYAGAIICFLFVIGLFYADRKYKIWLSICAVIGILLSYGDTLPSLNYFLFDYLPGYNKFRSVTFTIILAQISFTLLGFIGLENLMSRKISKADQKKLLTALATTGGLCFILILVAGMFSFTKNGEEQLPRWFLNALVDDRQSLMRADAWRSLIFISLAFVSLFFYLKTDKLSIPVLGGILTILILADTISVDKRFFGKDNYRRQSDRSFFTANAADQEIAKDNSDYRVYNLQGAWAEARTSYHHNSIGGYHGAKLHRYQDLYDYCLQEQTRALIQSLQQGNRDLSQFGVLNMLNAKYLTFGTERNSILPNNSALGSAWLVTKLKKVNSPDGELQATCEANTANEAVIDASKFTADKNTYDASGTIELVSKQPDELEYKAGLNEQSFAVFSEIYYPKGWKAYVDNDQVEILRANYVLRALELPKGKHTITFKFEPEAYYIGNTVTLVSCIILLLVVLGSIGHSIKQTFTHHEEPQAA